MFGPDPIDIFDYSPYFAWAYYGHIGIGLIALAAALVALASRKGGKRHRWWGYFYIGAVTVVCVTTVSLLADNFIPPLFLALCTAIYAIGGAWLALQKESSAVRWAERGLFVFEVVALAFFLVISISAARAGIIPPTAPVVLAIIPLILVAGDVNWFRHAHRRKQLRVRRHLARMIWGFVVVLRAPLVEIVAAGLPISQQVVIFAPLLLGLGLLWYFQRRWGGTPFGRNDAEPKAKSV